MGLLENFIFVVWIFPIFTLLMMVYGYSRYKLYFNNNASTKKIIIQITTIGNYNFVNRIINTVRSYNLNIPYELWVITESNSPEKYKNANKVVVVPKDFVSISKYKARALDYSTQIRMNLNITTDNIKILYLDDDSIPSKGYIEKCFSGNYDVMEGIIRPKLNYGTRYSYVENMRTLACMSVCSVFQSLGHPVWVHGEGLCVRASIEQKVGWKFDAIASEDLIFGHRCSSYKVKWGFVWESIYITSPWTFKDYFKQRKRWLWGNVHAISKILSNRSKLRLIIYYLIGGSFLWLSISGIILDLIFHRLEFTFLQRIFFYLSLICWLGVYGYIGYTTGEKNIKHIVMSIVLAWYVSFMNTFPIWIGLFFTRPTKFDVIKKEK
ncbi:MAG: glycosyltransferase family 2 protein [Candidatus Nitrosocosmicus sp.]